MKNALVRALRRTEGMAEIKMCRVLAHIAIATGMMAGMLPAQSLMDQVNFRRVSVGGFRLYGVSALPVTRLRRFRWVWGLDALGSRCIWADL